MILVNQKSTINYEVIIMKKKVISLAAVLFMMLSCFSPITALANDNNEHNYFQFATAVTRMDKNGNFEFEIEKWVKSDNFKANSNKITVLTQAMLHYDNGTTVTNSKNDNVKFKVELINGHNQKVVGSYIGKCDNIRGGLQFNVEKDKQYYLKISVYDQSKLGPHESIKGTGQVYDVEVV